MSALERLCEELVPGSARVGAAHYIDLVAGPNVTDRRRIRDLAIEAYYGDYAAPGYTGPTGHDDIDFRPPAAARLRKSWDFLTKRREPYEGDDEADVVVVGSGAGGGLIAAELGRAGLDVLVLEAGELRGAADHTRFELRANHRLWWPTRFVQVDGDDPLALLSGRCVGGTTVINTKVAMRAADFDLEPLPFDLTPYYERVERALGVRVRADWPPSVHLVRRGFQAQGADLEPVESYTDYTCSKCGACLQGCPTNAGRNTLNTWLAPALGRGEIRLATGAHVQHVIVENGKAAGVRHAGGVVRAPVVVLAAGALNTPQILQTRSETLGLHPARLVYGLFDEVQDCHQVYPITAHCLDFQRDFVIEATTIQDPVAFASSLPYTGSELTRVMRDYRRWAGMLVMANDENTATVDPGDVFTKSFSAQERHRLDAALAFAVEVLRSAGASRVIWTGLCTSHVQGSVPMGGVVDHDGQSRQVQGLYVGDASLIPRSLSVNPSLTIMALATKVADAIAAR